MTHDDLDYYDIALIGYIDLSESVGKCKVEVYGKEDYTAHFHIVSIDSDFNCAINISENKYNDKTKDKLTTIQCAILNKWLTEYECPFGKPITNWQSILIFWSGSNNDSNHQYIDADAVQPRYDLMNYNKEKL